jgi:aspartate 1-decarboxylase
MMKSKIHRATVTDADLNYVGSITLDVDLMKLADIREMEQVHVLDIDNGNRLITYAIPGGPGDVCLNGAAARLVSPGDKVIVLTYADYEDDELNDYSPQVVHVDNTNRPVPTDVAQQMINAERGPVLYEDVLYEDVLYEDVLYEDYDAGTS